MLACFQLDDGAWRLGGQESEVHDSGAGRSQAPAIATDGATRPPWPPVVQNNLATSSRDCTGGHEPNLGLDPFSELHHTSRTTMDGLNVVRMVSPQWPASPSSQDFPARFPRRKGQDRLSRVAWQQLQQHVRNRLRLMLISAS